MCSTRWNRCGSNCDSYARTAAIFWSMVSEMSTTNWLCQSRFSASKGNGTQSSGEAVVIPEVAGASVREAVLQLHRRGLKVTLRGMGNAVRTEPAAGATVSAGATVVLWTTE